MLNSTSNNDLYNTSLHQNIKIHLAKKVQRNITNLFKENMFLQ